MKNIIRVLKADYGIILLVLLLASGLYQVYQEGYEQRLQQEIAGKILRFHVRANSDSAKDQTLKLKVRDAVGEYMQECLADVDSLSACRVIVENHLLDIEKTAERIVQEEGFHYPVTANLENVDFPEKTYENFTFPAGNYQALNVVIGDGCGHNWWCVMYPNICFSGSVYKVEEQDAGQTLKRVLTEEEYDAVLKSGGYRIRFKYLDFLNKWFG